MSSEQIEGEVEEQLPNIGIYEGDRAANGARHGKGSNTFPNGDTYKGDYKDGMRHGQGMYTWKRVKKPFKRNSARYLGQYSNNMRHGQGLMAYPDGSRYKGEFVAGKRHGAGLYVYPNCDTYEGTWSENKRDGQGSYTIAETGSVIHGKWQNGLLFGAADICHEDHTLHVNFELYEKNMNPPQSEDAATPAAVNNMQSSRPSLPCSIEFKSQACRDFRFVTNEHAHVGVLAADYAMSEQKSNDNN